MHGADIVSSNQTQVGEARSAVDSSFLRNYRLVGRGQWGSKRQWKPISTRFPDEDIVTCS